MTAWAHLPNARHIDAVLAHVKAHPERWAGDGGAAAWDAARAAAWAATQDATQDAARADACDAAQDAPWAAARAAWGACSALVAWDDAGQLMEVPVDAVRTLAAAGHHPAVLLLPARLAMSNLDKE